MTIDDGLPAWDWRSAHATRLAAPPERCARAARVVSGRDLPLTGVLMRLRGLGRRMPEDRTLLQSMSGIGLAELADGPMAVVIGGVLAPWRPRGGRFPIDSIEAFRGFAVREMLATIRRRAEA